MIWIKIYSLFRLTWNSIGLEALNNTISWPWKTKIFFIYLLLPLVSMSRSLFSWLVTISLFSFSDFLYFDVKTKNFVSLVSHRKILNSECCLKMQNLVINRQFFDIYNFEFWKIFSIFTHKKIRQTLFTFQLNSAWLLLFWRIIFDRKIQKLNFVSSLIPMVNWMQKR